MSIASRFVSDQTVFYAGLFCLALFAWFCHSYHWDLVQAYSGFSPITYAMQWVHPENFARDFPSGVGIMDGSSVMYVYKLAYGLLGIHPEVTGYALILIEIVLMMLAFVLLARVIDPNISKTALFILVAMVVASRARDVNLAHFAFPFFEGHYYNVADFMRIMAIVAIMLRRYILAGVFIGLCFTVHPIYALTGGVFMAAYVVADVKDLRQVRLWGGALAAAGLAGAWYYFMLRTGADSLAEKIPASDWFAFSFLNSHWYPRYEGMFAGGAPHKLLPFLSLMILFLHYFLRRGPFSRLDRGVFYGMAAMAVLAALGIVFAEQRSHPMLVKLCLLRACDVAVLVALPYVVMGLLTDITKGKWYTAVPALGIMISPFIDPVYAGWHGGLVMVLVLPVLVSKGGRLSDGCWMAKAAYSALIFMAALFVAMAAKYITAVPPKMWGRSMYYASDMLAMTLPAMMAAGLFYMVVWRRSLSKLTVVAVTFALSLFFLWNDRDLASGFVLEKARSYKDVQVWVRKNTPVDALFMVEPSVQYGWRAYAQRSSFGNVREQYLISWMYNSDYKAYAEGQERLAIYGADMKDLALNAPAPRRAISNAASDKYNDLTQEAWHSDLVREYGIDYFVFEKARFQLAATPDEIADIWNRKWKTMYENDMYIVAKLK